MRKEYIRLLSPVRGGGKSLDKGERKGKE